MNRITTCILLLVALLVVGCKSKPKNELADVPPPPAYDPVAFEPVQVEPVTTTSSDVVIVEETTIYSPPASTSGGGGTTYTVQKGDTLWKIAQAQYGSGQKWQAIVEANPGINPKKLAVGQTITLP